MNAEMAVSNSRLKSGSVMTETLKMEMGVVKTAELKILMFEK